MGDLLGIILPSYVGIKPWNKDPYWPTSLGGGLNSHIFCEFSPRKLGKMNPIWLAHIFQRGWFNHQLVLLLFFYHLFFVVRDTFIASFSLKSANFLATYLYKASIRMLVDFLAAVTCFFLVGWWFFYYTWRRFFIFRAPIDCSQNIKKTLVFSNIWSN